MLTPILLSAALAATLAAQSTKPLSGRIVDRSGQGIAGATVEAIPLSGTTVTTVTDTSGAYSFDGLVPGRYQINVKRAEFDGAVLFTEIIAGETARVNTTLRSIDALMPGETPKRIRVGANVQANQIVKKVPPRYPIEAKLARVEGTVTLSVVISREGRASQITMAESPDSSLTKSAVDAVQQWEWKPTLLNGVPVEVLTKIDINYTLAK